MKDAIEKLIASALEELKLGPVDFVVENPGRVEFGDYMTNAGIKTGKSREIFDWLESNKLEDIERVELKSGFINFYLSKEFFKKSIEGIIEQGRDFGRNKSLAGQRIIVEHTQPNPFKEFHIGHLMNNAVGESISRLIRVNGAEVRTASYHGDIGLHVAKAIFDVKNRGLWMIRDVRDTAAAYVKGSELYEKSPTFRKEIDELNKKIYEKSDIEINRLYESGKEASLNEFNKLYAKLGSHFDFNFFESQSGPIGKDLVLANIGSIFEESQGAVVFRGEKYGLHTRVFLNKDKLPTYEAKELGLAQIKKETFPFDQSITITANEQNNFFKVVEAAIEEVFPELKNKLKHLSHGMLRLPSGKMSSRTGDVITAEELIEEVKKKTESNEEVAIGAIKYMILRQSIGSDIIFDIDKSVSTEGDSGVYLQYAYARTCSLLEKAASQGITLGTSQGNALGGETRAIEKLLYRFPEVVERAHAEYAPNLLATYLTELAASFNNFYAQEQVISDEPEAPYRLAITRAFNTVMKNGLDILAIPTPERI